jgi:hypothetical protein
MGPFLHFAEAQDHVRRGSVTTGRTLAQELVLTHPTHELAPRAWQLIAESWNKTGRGDSARATYEGLLRQFPTGEHVPVTLYKLGQLALREADTAQAMHLWETVVARHRDTDEAELARSTLQTLQRAASSAQAPIPSVATATLVLPPRLPSPSTSREQSDSAPTSPGTPTRRGASANPPRPLAGRAIWGARDDAPRPRTTTTGTKKAETKRPTTSTRKKGAAASVKTSEKSTAPRVKRKG